MATVHPLEALSFVPLSANILLYTPPTDPQAAQLPSPRLIIMTTWLGGSTPARIAVYCRNYQKLYPSTPILLIRTLLTNFRTTSLADRRKLLAPARDYLLRQFPNGADISPSSNKSNGVLLHVFSNGGLNTAVQLSRLMRETGAKPSTFPVPVFGIILDSCPGKITFTKTYNAAVLSLPKSGVVNVVGRVVLYPYVGLYAAAQHLGISTFINTLRSSLNDVAAFGPGPRLYMHSQADQVMSPEDVSSHAEEAEAKGFRVQREVWENASHCALAADDRARYWNTIEAFVAREFGGRDAKL